MGEIGYYTLGRATSNQEANQYDLHVNCAGTSSFMNPKSVLQFRYDYHLIYLVEGSAGIKTSQIDVILNKGDMIILPPHTESIFTTLDTSLTDYMWLHFTGKNTDELLKRVNIETETVYNIGVHAFFKSEWKKLFSEFITNDNYFEELSTMYLNSIIINFSRYIKNKNSHNQLKSLRYIHENLFTDLAVSVLAEIEGCSESSYRNKFNNIMGVSPLEYIIDRRIEAAKIHINNTDRSIVQIAKSVGYEDPYYFSRIFKKKVGISPDKYRKAQNVRDVNILTTNEKETD